VLRTQRLIEDNELSTSRDAVAYNEVRVMLRSREEEIEGYKKHVVFLCAKTNRDEEIMRQNKLHYVFPNFRGGSTTLKLRRARGVKIHDLSLVLISQSFMYT
jgi:hypothetical protein